MTETASAVIVCGGCKKKFAWKSELAGKRVKCKCGQAIQVPGAAVRVAPKPVVRAASVPKPAPPKPVPVSDDGGLDDLYALAEDADRASAAMPVEVVDYVPEVTPAPVKRTNRLAAAGGVPLAYQGGPNARQQRRAAEAAAALVDPMRDLYAPIAFLVVGVIAYMSYYIVRFNLSSGAIPVVGFGVVLLMIVKTVLLVGFAFAMAGPLSVGFGSLWTAVLKLAAIAVFVDGATAWVDLMVRHMSGGYGSGSFATFGLIGWPVAIGLYWGLLIYLFGMDPGDSRMVVLCLALFDRIVKFVIFMLLLNLILGWGGIAAPASSMGGLGNKASTSTPASALATHVDELKQADSLIEARKYLAAGHQLVIQKSTDAWYAAGCPNVWFEMTGRDINGHRTEMALIVELPTDAVKRANCFTILKGYYKDIGSVADPEDLNDTGDDYLELPLR